MQTWLRKRGWEIFCLILFLILVGYQIFVPPVTGLANNSDFVYVLGKFQICPADREQQDKIYLVTDYFIDPVSCTWESGLTSVEIPLVYAATYLSQPFTGEKNFDLRALAAVHLIILLTAFGILLSLTCRAGPAVRFGVPALFMLIFSDVSYTAYLNSVYLDAPAMVLLLASVAVATAASLNHNRWTVVIAYLIFATALVFSKSQHAILGLAFATLALVFIFRPGRRWFRVAWGATAGVLIVSTGIMLSLTPDHYKIFALYDTIFGRISPHNVEPWNVLKDVGLGDDDVQWVNTHAYLPSAPVYNDAWAKQFLQRTSFSKLIWFYLRNPDVVFDELNRDLTNAAPVMRPKDMANYRQKDGYPPGTMADRFDVWSNLRSGALRVFPYHVLVFYLAPWVVWIAGWKWRKLWSPLLPLALVLSASGIVEFSMSTLTDALDNSRHLFLFQVITELMILMTAAALANLYDNRHSQTKQHATAQPTFAECD